MKRKQFKAELLSGHNDNAIEVPFDPFFMIVDAEIMKAAKLSVGDIVTTTVAPLG